MTATSTAALRRPPRRLPWPVANVGVGGIFSLIACTTSISEHLASDDDAAQQVQSAALNYEGGEVVLHRLNRAEYNNSVRDLLSTKLTPASAFTLDATAAGFDNNAAALTVSPGQMLNYQLAAETLAAEATGSAHPATLELLAPCAASEDSAACLTRFVSTFGLRAWRRPLRDEEISTMVSAATELGSTYPAQVEAAIVSFLMSPHFLFRVELDPDPDRSASHPLDGYALAARLSYFVWSSTPDDALLAAAADGSLVTDAGLGQALARMLADPRAASIEQNFVGQWLQLRNTEDLLPDPSTFPKWTPSLRDAMVAQTQKTFADLLQGQAPLQSVFLDANTYMNDDLASFYGLAPPGSTALVKVPVPTGPRQGLFGQAAVLAATSFPSRTSLVHRGQFVLSQMLCAPPPPAPPDVPQLAPVASDAPKSQRQRLETHILAPSCAACHDAMDPYGFVLEQFDAIGALRTTDNGVAIDTRAVLSSGQQLSDVQDLEALLAKDPRVPNCFVQQLWTYALGRVPEDADSANLTSLRAGFLADNQQIGKLVGRIVMSRAFRSRHRGI